MPGFDEHDHNDDGGHIEVVDPTLFDPTNYASVDGLGGTTGPNGKPIWTAAQAAAYLFRAGAGYGTTLNMVMPTSGTLDQLNYGFHTGQASLAANGYVYQAVPGGNYFAFSEYFNFSAFSEAQRAAAREAIQYWDDVVATRFVETNINDADIAFGNYTNQPGTQAYARLLANTITSDPFINAQIRDVGGDVWIARNTQSNFQLDEGGYGMNTLVHEIGHGFGMLHPGNYNASPGVPLSYAANAEYYQDTRSYSILSYWNPRDIGARDFDFTLMNIAYGATPMVHDILAMQTQYGADMTTRTGDTVYGFNSTAGRDAFDFVRTPAPMMAIWDAGGIDTLDASGYSTNQVINLTPGSLSSIGGITAAEFPSFAQVNANRAAANMPLISQATYDANRSVFMTNPGLYGRITDNVGIAYGAIIENAVGGSGNDSMIGNHADNVMRGNAGNDLIASGLGNDTLDGGTGNDEMLGGAGNDLYFVESSGDIVTELLGEGSDTVSSAINYALGANVENLLLTGAAAAGTGNELDNAITGNALANVLSGLGGNDRLVGGEGDDSLDGGAGDDVMIGGLGNDLFFVDAAGDVVVEAAGEGSDTVSSAINYALGDHLENLVLTGTATAGTGNALDNVVTGNALANLLSGLAGDDRLIGDGGDDTLDGGAGNDTMIGGLGNDIYIVGEAGDVVREAAGEGIDTVRASIDYILGANLENLVLSGNAIRGTGNELANTLTGNALSNRLFGGAGDDRLIGGDGVDYLTGGAGNDVFVAQINSTRVASRDGPISLDVVMDFTAGDRIDVHGLGFADFDGHRANRDAGDLTIRTFGNINAAEAALGIDIDGVDGPSSFGGPVTIVLGNIDGGAPDFALALVGVSGVTPSDFIF